MSTNSGPNTMPNNSWTRGERFAVAAVAISALTFLLAIMGSSGYAGVVARITHDEDVIAQHQLELTKLSSVTADLAEVKNDVRWIKQSIERQSK